MMRIVLGVAATVAMGSAFAQSPPAPKPAVVVHADAGVVQVQGNAPIAVDATTGANLGDTVTVSGGKATLTYADGCIISIVGAHQVAAVSPCKAGLVPRSVLSAVGDGKMVAIGLGAIVAVGLAVGSGGGNSASSP